MGVWEFLSGPITGIIDGVRGIIDDVSTTDEERLGAQRALVGLQQEFQKGVLEAQTKMVEQQSAVLQTEIASQHWLAANWRPILMLVFTYIILHNFVIHPMFGVGAVEIPGPMWELLKIGVGGYIGFRSIEKIVPRTKWGD